MAGPPPTIDWNAVIADPRFQELHRKKQRFLTSLMVFAVAFYFLLPVGAAYFQDLFRARVWGVINFGLLFALLSRSLESFLHVASHGRPDVFLRDLLGFDQDRRGGDVNGGKKIDHRERNGHDGEKGYDESGQPFPENSPELSK